MMLGYHDKAIELRKDVLEAVKRVVPPDNWLTLHSMVELARDYTTLNRLPEARLLLDEVLDKAQKRPGIAPRQVVFAIGQRVRDYQKTGGDFAKFRALTELLDKAGPTDPLDLYNAACYQAVIASMEAKAKAPDAAHLAGEDADKAMAWLTKMVAAGYPADIRKDADLEFLRNREDFKKLLAELENGSPKPEKKPALNNP
jgi:hypothetical protein